MKKFKLQNVIIFLIFLYSVIFLADLWFDVFSGETLFKITTSFIVFFVAIVAIIFTKNSFTVQDKLKDDNFIN